MKKAILILLTIVSSLSCSSKRFTKNDCSCSTPRKMRESLQIKLGKDLGVLYVMCDLYVKDSFSVHQYFMSSSHSKLDNFFAVSFGEIYKINDNLVNLDSILSVNNVNRFGKNKIKNKINRIKQCVNTVNEKKAISNF